jgi:hypothetical protein
MSNESARPKRFGWVTVAAFCVVAAAVGASIRGFFPPFTIDDPFWRSFWSGPPAAGLFAVVAACIAFFPAYRSTRIARENAAREQWWNRTSWALGRAASGNRTDREVANEALLALSEEATEMEMKMILGVMRDLHESRIVDNHTTSSENEKERRRWPWRARS